MSKICVVGLGYVGLPLAIEFAKKNKVIGFEINKKKIDDLKRGIDPTNEVGNETIKKCSVEFTIDPKKIKECDFIIIAVPTPVDEHNTPDLKYVVGASEIVGKNLSKGAIVVYESTVWPGVTEDICLPILEKESSLKLGEFGLGYSPERVNPGDKEHTIDKITKIVSGSDNATLEKVAEVYGTIISAGIHKASSIKVAEAAKVIENIQRDLNIALMNELSIIFSKMNISTKEVIDAASTKWNFHKYRPGLVGGHCIGVDPYYLTFKAQELGYHPEVILAGRRINDDMHKHIVELLIKGLNNAGKTPKNSKVLVMGLTFKENVNDPRNSRTKHMIKELKSYGVTVFGCDPFLDNSTVQEIFGIKNDDFKKLSNLDAVIFTVPHKQFLEIKPSDLMKQMAKNPVMIDIPNIFKKEDVAAFAHYTL